MNSKYKSKLKSDRHETAAIFILLIGFHGESIEERMLIVLGSVGGFGFGRFAVQGGEEFLGGRRCRHRSLENDVLGTQVLLVQVLVAVLIGRRVEPSSEMPAKSPRERE